MRTLNRLGRLEVSPDSQQNADPAPPSPLLTAAGMHGAAKERLASLVYGRTGGGGGNFLAGTGGSGSGSNSRGGGGHFVSLSRNFINDLKQLMCQLQSAEMHLHFIRCFVPNAQMLPLTFNRLLLLKQVRRSEERAHFVSCWSSLLRCPEADRRGSLTEREIQCATTDLPRKDAYSTREIILLWHF